MHFVINVFVTAVCFISIILFKEILNKIVKVLLSVIGCGTLSYALAILVKKCGEWFGCWSGDAQYIKSDIIFIQYILLLILLLKKIKLNFQALFFYTHCFFSQPISNFVIIIPTVC